MNRLGWDRGRMLVGAVGCTALLGAISATATARQINAQASGSSDSARDVNQLRQQVLALEKRVEELEKEELEKFKADEIEDDAREKKTEQRLAQLEKAQDAAKNDDKASKAPEGAGDDLPMTVRAPFVVQDDSGKTIFRVDIAPIDNRARIMVGNPIGARAEIGPNTDGASVGLYDSSNTWRAALIGRSDESHIELRGPGKGIAVQIKADAIGGDLTLSNAAGLGNARLTIGKGGSGNFTLGDSAGAIVVQAGTMGNGVGVVQAGPRMGGLVGGIGGSMVVIPYAIMGKK